VNTEARKQLELDQVLDSIAKYTSGNAAAAWIGRREMASNPGDLKEIHKKKDWLRKFLSEHEQTRFVSDELDNDFFRLKEGVGSWPELEELVQFLYNHLAHSKVLSQREGSDPLDCFPGYLPDCFAQVVKALKPVFGKSGRFDEASYPPLVELKKLRLEREQTALKTARAFLASHASIRQESEPVLRNNRVVLPLKRSSGIRGMVQDVSASGRTMFIEHDELIELNNSIAELRIGYDQMLAKLFNQSWKLVHEQEDLILGQWRIWVEMEAWRAVVLWEDERGCTRIEISQEIRLYQARHPLLGDAAIGLDIEFIDESRFIVLSGPNGGGKSVALKTLGLFVLMNQWGLDLPAAPGSCITWFPKVFALIGDEQSLFDHLSTFTARLSRLKELFMLDGPVLVLLDELGAGTDPKEGDALAQSVLLELLNRQCWGMVTTHLTGVKHLAHQDRRLQNAGMEWDAERSSPTFKLKSGELSGSQGIGNAEKIGLPEQVILKARELLEAMEIPSETLERQLRKKHEEADDRLRSIKEKEQQLSRSKEQLEQEVQRHKREHLANQSRMRSELEELYAQFKSLRENFSQEQAGAVARDLQKKLSREREAIKESESELRVHPEEYRPGMELVFGTPPSLVTLKEKRKAGSWLCLRGSIKIELSESDLYLPPETQAEIPVKKDLPSEVGQSNAAFASSGNEQRLDVRGLRAVEAEQKIEGFLRQAQLMGHGEIQIIHGHGVLESVLKQVLESSGIQHQTRHAKIGEGGRGKTIISLYKI
jgi:DNA mismatch repair protein MutS2